MLWVDPPQVPGHGRLWSHLVSDSSVGELLEFGDRLGLHPRSFDADHYDVPSERYDEVVAAGAQPTTSQDLLRRLVASGLRVPKRKGERLLAWRDTMLTDAPARWELLSSSIEHDATRHELIVLRGTAVLLDHNGLLPPVPPDHPALPVGHARIRAGRTRLVETAWWKSPAVDGTGDQIPSGHHWVPLSSLRASHAWPLLTTLV